MLKTAFTGDKSVFHISYANGGTITGNVGRGSRAYRDAVPIVHWAFSGLGL